jgi:transcriptional regulator with GAF, ATPase, and Fis domain
MEMEPGYQPDYDSFKTLLLEMGRQRSMDGLLRLIVQRLAARPHVALARIWLLQPGDICATCPMRDQCPDQTACLHMVASAGHSWVDPSADWSRTDGDFRRFPIGIRKVGLIASTAEGLLVEDVEAEAERFARPEWIRAEKIRGFGGQPLIHQDEVLGVIAVFTRIPAQAEGMLWLRMIADHTATAVVNARAFEQIEHLRNTLEMENEYLRQEVREALAFGEILGESVALRGVVEQIELVAPTDASVLIFGESGTGKELVAREIHKRSRRRDKPMVKVNCASIPRELYESEFFGHVRGAFTGALRDRIGRFELASGGTLFLDEVGEIPVELQGKLLRVLQEGTYERVGEERTRNVDVRIVAATNRDLRRDVEEGRFRRDLFYRLNVFPIEIAPLRDRDGDIPVLARHFVDVAARKLNCSTMRLTDAELLKLQNYPWPGNVRELQNVIERAVIMSRCGDLRFQLPDAAEVPVAATPLPATSVVGEGGVASETEMRQRERENILAALERSRGKIYGQGGAAELLGLRPTTLASRIKKLGIRRAE